MNNKSKLLVFKLIHSFIWLIMVTAIIYTIYSGIVNNINILTYLSILLIFLEGIILLIANGKSPITIFSYKYSEVHEPGFDIFLPKTVAKYNKLIFGTIFVIGLIIIIY